MFDFPSAAFFKKRGKKIPPNYFIYFIPTLTILYSGTPEYLKLLIFEMKTPAICKLSNLIQHLSVNRILLTSTISRGRG